MTLVSYGRNLSERAHRHPDRTVIVHVDVDGRERPLTWRELDERSNQVARLFQTRGAGQRRPTPWPSPRPTSSSC